MNRRRFLLGAAALAGGASVARGAPVTELRIGYQKTAVLLVVKAQKRLERRFEPKGVTIKWVEFAFGPPQREAINAGAVDYG